MLEIGSSVADRYTIERHLAQGGMGAIYVARDTKFDTQVAVKVAVVGGEAQGVGQVLGGLGEVDVKALTVDLGAQGGTGDHGGHERQKGNHVIAPAAPEKE